MRSFKSFLTVLLAVLLGCFYGTSIRAQDLVGSGAGEAEQNFVIAWESLEKNMELCLLSPGCSSSEAERDILRSLIASMELEYELGGIQFVESTLGRRIFETESRIGAVILVNERSIYRGQGLHVEAMSLEEASSTLMRALYVHHSIEDNPEAEALAPRFQNFLSRKYSFRTLAYFNLSFIRLLLWDDVEDRLILDDAQGLHNIGQVIQNQMQCPRGQLSRVQFQTLAWGTDAPAFDTIWNRQSFSLNGRVEYECEGRLRNRRFFYSTVFRVETPEDQRHWVGNEETSQFYFLSEQSRLIWLN